MNTNKENIGATRSAIEAGTIGASAASSMTAALDSASPYGNGTLPVPPSIDVALDFAGPEKGILLSGAVTDDERAILRGVGEPGSVVTIHDNGQVVGSITVDGLGSWQFDFGGRFANGHLLEPGDHTLTASYADGTTSAPFDLHVVIAESSRPKIDAVIDDVGQAGVVVEGGTTDDARPGFRGHGLPGAYIQLVDGSNGSIGATTVKPDGTWEINKLSQALAEGEHTIKVYQDNVASEPFTFHVQYSAQTPRPSIDSAYDNEGITANIPNGGSTDDTTPTLSGRGEPNTTVVIYDNGNAITSAVVDGAGNWRATFSYGTMLEPGEHVLTVADGGRSSEAFTLTVTGPDLSAPSIESAYDNEGITANIPNGGSTDDTTPTLSGRGVPNTTVVICDNGEGVLAVPVDSAGNWRATFNYSTMLQPGEHVLTVVGSNNVSSEAFTLTVTGPDLSAPSIESAYDNEGITANIPNGGSTDDTTPTLSGRGVPNTTVVICDNGEGVLAVPVDSAGNWRATFNYSTMLQPGEHVLTVVGSNNVSSEAFTLTVTGPDLSAPSIESAYDNEGITANIPNGGSTDDTTPTLSGRGVPNTTVVICDNGEGVLAVPVDSAGNWRATFNYSTMLQPGEHVLTVVGSNNVSSEAFTLTVTGPDLSAPSIESAYDNEGITANIPNGGSTDDTTPTLSGRGVPNTTVVICDNGEGVLAVPVDSAGNWRATFNYSTMLQPGEHVLTVVGSNNVSSEAFTLTVTGPDLSAPSIESAYDNEGITANIPNGGSTDDTTPTLSGRGVPNTTVVICDNGEGVLAVPVDSAGNWRATFNYSTMLQPGEHVLTVVGSNNVSSEAFTLTVTGPDLSAPSIESAYDNEGITANIPNGGSTDDTTPTLSGRGVPNTTVVICDNGEGVLAVPVDSAGNWRATFNYSTMLQPGEHVLTVVGSNNVSSEAFTLTVTGPDLSAPSIESAYDNEGITANIPNGGSTDDTTPTLSGRGVPNTTVVICDNGEGVLAVPVDSAGNWRATFNYSTMLQPGEHVLTVVGSNNVSSEAFTLTVTGPDLSAPSIESAYDNEGITANIPNGGSTDDTTPTLSGRGVPNTTVVIYDNGNVMTSAVVDANGNWRAPGSLSPALHLGEHVLTVVGSNNVSSEPFTLTVTDLETFTPSIDLAFGDNDPLTDILSGGSTVDTTPGLIGHGEPNTTVSIYDNGNFLTKAPVDGTGTWYVYGPFAPTLEPGEHVLTVVGSDNASSEPFVLTVIGPDVAPLSVELAHVNEGTDALVFALGNDQAASGEDALVTLSLSDLLQAPGELFAAPAHADPANDTAPVRDLMVDFASDPGASVVSSEGVSVTQFPLVVPAELWQEHAVA